MSTMNFSQFQQEDRRLCLLLALEQAAGYEANHFLLHQFLDFNGHNISHDQVISEGEWLAEQGLASIQKMRDSYILRLTIRGVDCANGRVVIHGVKRPMPGTSGSAGGVQ